MTELQSREFKTVETVKDIHHRRTEVLSRFKNACQELEEGSHRYQYLNRDTASDESYKDPTNLQDIIDSHPPNVIPSNCTAKDGSPEPETDFVNGKGYHHYMETMETSIKHIKNDQRKKENGNYMESYAKQLQIVSKNYISAINETDGRLKLEIGRKLASSGLVSILCDIASDVLNLDLKDIASDVYIHLKERVKGMDDTDMTVLKFSLNILVNFSDSIQTDTPIICNHPEFLERTAKFLTYAAGTATEKVYVPAGTPLTLNDPDVLIKNAKNAKSLIVDPDKIKKESRLQNRLYTLLAIIHNLAMFESNISKIRSFDYVKILTPYLVHWRDNIRLIAIAAMSDIVNEKESAVLQNGQDVLRFMKDILQLAMWKETRKHPMLSWRVWELTRVMRKVAKNDSIKKALVDLGFLPLLVEIAKSQDEREQREAIGALRTLSFDENIQKEMTSDVYRFGVIDIIVESLDSKDPIIANSSRGALWNMREELMKHDKYKDIDIVKQFAAHKAKEQEELDTRSKKGHIMISYQWSNQQVLLKVRDHLRANGFKIWMDVDDMAGSTLDAMARAVEEAEVVLICYSRKYKASDNCHAEAEYAFEKRKHVIPLRMEQQYKADGWLGMIIGAKKYYDFSGKYTHDSITDDLLKDLRKTYLDNQDIVPQKASEVYRQPSVLSPPPAIYSSGGTGEDVESWDSTQVGKWLDKNGLDRSQFGNLRGVEIYYLKFLLEKSPDYNKTLIEDLKIKDLFTKAKFTLALSKTNL